MRSVRAFTDQAFLRTAGAPLIAGNRLRLLKDASENYPAWIAAMESAEKWIHFETYIIHEDDLGRQFADLLSKKAAEGVRVRLIYDWVGSLGKASLGFWKRLTRAGVLVRCFNPIGPESPFGWLSRDHRKTISVDGRIAYVSGLCVGQPWIGFPNRGIPPWRDTGVEIEGPAVSEMERAFADAWAATGEPLHGHEVPAVESIEPVGDISMRIVPSTPNVGSIYRLDQLMAAMAQQSIWLADAYFIGTNSYVQALRAAATSGVDVRFLMPGANDVPVMRAVARAGLRPLLEAGVRVFEWNGSMMHAKTAVVDGRWARVGSTNLNIASWLGNWELDVVVEDNEFAKGMEQMYLDDLAQSTEIVLEKVRRRPVASRNRDAARQRKRRAAGLSRTAAGVMRLSQTVSAAMTNRRELGPAEAVIMFWAASLLVALSVIAAIWPRVLVIPFVTLCVWTAISLLVRIYKLRSKHNRRRR